MDKIKIIPDEVMEKVMVLDCREEQNIRRLKKSLMKLPFINSEEDLETDKLDKRIQKIESKYDIKLGYIMRNIEDNQYTYNGMIKADVHEDGKKTNGKWVNTAYGCTMWETLAKTLFFMYYWIQKNKGKNN